MEIIIESWKHCQEKKGLEIYGWCIIPSHVHMIIGSKNYKPEDIIKDMKKHTSSTIKTTIKNNLLESRKEWIIPDFLREWKARGRKMVIIKIGNF